MSDGVPTMVYRRPQPGDETTETMHGIVAFKIVNLGPGDRIPTGWLASYADAAAGGVAAQATGLAEDTATPVAPGIEPVSEIDTLRAHAESIGIKVDGRWSVQKLKAKIAAEESV